MKTQLILIITYVVSLFLYMIVLWRISKWQKLKRQNLATAFIITAIITVVSLTLMIPYLLGIIFPIVIRILINIFTFILAIFLIKKFYQTGWWKAIKIYLLVILFAFLIMTAISFIIFTLYFFLKLVLYYFFGIDL